MFDNRAGKTTHLWNSGHHEIAGSEEENACAKQATEITNGAPRPVSFTAASAPIRWTHMDQPTSHCRTKEFYTWTFAWLATTAPIQTSRFSKHVVMQSRKHPISELLLRVIARKASQVRNQFVTSHRVVFTPASFAISYLRLFSLHSTALMVYAIKKITSYTTAAVAPDKAVWSRLM